ncbi:MAG: hypothetical protein QM723_20415 [Myxococcaceae bacterium]
MLVSKLAPTYAQTHEVDIDEAVERVDRALERDRTLQDDLLAACWVELTAKKPRFDEAALLERWRSCSRTVPNAPARWRRCPRAGAPFWC